MTTHERAVLELSTIIQPGDLLTLVSGSAFISAGSPANSADYMKRERGGIANPYRYSMWINSWLVSVRMDSCCIPVNLYAVVRVERGEVEIWNVEDKRTPIQDKVLI